MFESTSINRDKKPLFFSDLAKQLAGLLDGESDPIANAANTSALIFHAMPDLNWAGFYFVTISKELVLGPFQGKPACVRIPIGRGVCGTAVERRQSILVQDVHSFPGHIACDANSQSELVVPLIADGMVIGVLDLDSPRLGRFDDEDRLGVERLAEAYVAHSWSDARFVGR